MRAVEQRLPPAALMTLEHRMCSGKYLVGEWVGVLVCGCVQNEGSGTKITISHIDAARTHNVFWNV